MLLWLTRALRRVRHVPGIGALTIIGLVVLAIVGNSFFFYLFESPQNAKLTWVDAIWYSVISITTIGYGDFYPTTLGARISTIIFIVIIGLAAFGAFIGLTVDAIVDANNREEGGLNQLTLKDHVLIINFPSEARIRQIISQLRAEAEFASSEIAIVTDAVMKLPFKLPGISFVRGSPLQEETLQLACVEKARMALILSPRPNDPDSDSIVASIGSVIEHLRPESKTIAECMDERHAILFESAGFDAVVYGNRITNHLLVQEVQDEGVSAFVEMITTAGEGLTVFSAPAEAAGGDATTYRDVAKKLLDDEATLVGVLRDKRPLAGFMKASRAAGDTILYLAAARILS